MIGYHYTSSENYEKIRNEGLAPYWIRKKDLELWFSEGIHGIWLWKNDLTDTDHLGSILWQLMTKASTNIVKLRVEYEEVDQYVQYGYPVEILHDGKLGVWDYHHRVPAVILGKPVPPARIAMVAKYDLCASLAASVLK
jgi:hypothetical protein